MLSFIITITIVCNYTCIIDNSNKVCFTFTITSKSLYIYINYSVWSGVETASHTGHCPIHLVNVLKLDCI